MKFCLSWKSENLVLVNLVVLQGEHVGLGKQLLNHKVIVSLINGKLRSAKKARRHLNKCLYYVNIGSNDYINNYFKPEHYQSSHMFSPDQFAEALILEYSRNLKVHGYLPQILQI